MSKNQIEVGYRDACDTQRARIDVTVPGGMTRKDLHAVLERVLPDLERLRPRGCLACLSGLDINIRERFEQVLIVDL